VLSFGGGLLITPRTTTVSAGVRRSDAGAASGLMNTAKQVGGALGLAGLVAIAAGPGRTPEALAAHYGRAFAVIAATLVAVAGAALTLLARRDAV
jgi:sugar phosphate permease